MHSFSSGIGRRVASRPVVDPRMPGIGMIYSRHNRRFYYTSSYIPGTCCEQTKSSFLGLSWKYPKLPGANNMINYLRTCRQDKKFAATRTPKDY